MGTEANTSGKEKALQLHLTLKTASAVLPINYRPLIHGMIYHSLKEDAVFAEKLHSSERTGEKERPFKGFTFSPLLGPYSVSDHTICFLDEAKLEIRAWQEELIRLLYACFSKTGSVQLGSERLAIRRCELTDTRLNTDSAAIRMVSPVVAYKTDQERHTVFFRPDEEQFYHALVLNAKRKSETFLPEVPFVLRVQSMNPSLPRSQFSSFKRTFITGWFGRYRLEGDPRIIDMLYQTGLGAKNSEGFGVFSNEPSL